MMAACSRTLTCGLWRWARVHRRPAAWAASACAAMRARSSGEAPHTSSGSSIAKCGSSGTSRGTRRGASNSVAEARGDVLERPVLEQPGEQEVPRLEQLEVLGVLDLALRQQSRGLEVQQVAATTRNSHATERSHSTVAIADVARNSSVTTAERDLGDLQLVLGDQAEKQVEGPGEVVEVHREGPLASRRRRRSRQAATPRATSSRASWRYCSAPACVGANVRIGSAATVASGNLTVRPIIVSVTWSPNASRTRSTTSWE